MRAVVELASGYPSNIRYRQYSPRAASVKRLRALAQEPRRDRPPRLETAGARRFEFLPQRHIVARLVVDYLGAPDSRRRPAEACGV